MIHVIPLFGMQNMSLKVIPASFLSKFYSSINWQCNCQIIILQDLFLNFYTLFQTCLVTGAHIFFKEGTHICYAIFEKALLSRCNWTFSAEVADGLCCLLREPCFIFGSGDMPMVTGPPMVVRKATLNWKDVDRWGFSCCWNMYVFWEGNLLLPKCVWLRFP